jgi:hypothetical protein
MKKLILLPVLLLSGCLSQTALVHEIANSNAAGHFEVKTVYGSIVYDRANPGTNNITVTSQGISTWRPQ